MSSSPTQCSDVSASRWMLNSRNQNPCEVVQSVLQICEPDEPLPFLPLDFTCPVIDTPPPPASTSTSAFDLPINLCCCSSTTFALLSACWSCQWSAQLDGRVRTTWSTYIEQCFSGTRGEGGYAEPVQRRLDAQGIDLPPWSFIPPTDGAIWDEYAALVNASVTNPDLSIIPPIPTTVFSISTVSVAPSSSAFPVAPVEANSTSTNGGAIAGATLGALAVFFLLVTGLLFCWRKRAREKRRFKTVNNNGHPSRAANSSGDEEKGLDVARTRLDLDVDLDPVEEGQMHGLAGINDGGNRRGRRRTTSSVGSGIQGIIGKIKGRSARSSTSNLPPTPHGRNRSSSGAATRSGSDKEKRHTPPNPPPPVPQMQQRRGAIGPPGLVAINLSPPSSASGSPKPALMALAAGPTPSVAVTPSPLYSPNSSGGANDPPSAIDRPTVPLSPEVLKMAKVGEDGFLFVPAPGSSPTSTEPSTAQHEIATVPSSWKGKQREVSTEGAGGLAGLFALSKSKVGSRLSSLASGSFRQKEQPKQTLDLLEEAKVDNTSQRSSVPPTPVLKLPRLGSFSLAPLGKLLMGESPNREQSPSSQALHHPPPQSTPSQPPPNSYLAPSHPPPQTHKLAAPSPTPLSPITGSISNTHFSSDVPPIPPPFDPSRNPYSPSNPTYPYLHRKEPEPISPSVWKSSDVEPQGGWFSDETSSEVPPEHDSSGGALRIDGLSSHRNSRETRDVTVPTTRATSNEGFETDIQTEESVPHRKHPFSLQAVGISGMHVPESSSGSGSSDNNNHTRRATHPVPIGTIGNITNHPPPPSTLHGTAGHATPAQEPSNSPPTSIASTARPPPPTMGHVRTSSTGSMSGSGGARPLSPGTYRAMASGSGMGSVRSHALPTPPVPSRSASQTPAQVQYHPQPSDQYPEIVAPTPVPARSQSTGSIRLLPPLPTQGNRPQHPQS